MNKLEKEFAEFLHENGIAANKYCSDKENQMYLTKYIEAGVELPEDIYLERNGDDFLFYTIQQPDYSSEKLKQLLAYKEFKTLRTIKNCVVFFTILTIIGLVCGAIYLLTLL